VVVQPGCRPDHVNARIPQAILRDVQLTNASLAPANLTRRRCRAHSLEARHIRVSMHRPLLASAALQGGPSLIDSDLKDANLLGAA
jgi:uncharacterized protein YjbI with pentapeptide repeats